MQAPQLLRLSHSPLSQTAAPFCFDQKTNTTLALPSDPPVNSYKRPRHITASQGLRAALATQLLGHSYRLLARPEHFNSTETTATTTVICAQN